MDIGRLRGFRVLSVIAVFAVALGAAIFWDGTLGRGPAMAQRIVARPTSLVARGYLAVRTGGARQTFVAVKVATPIRDIYLPGVDAVLVDSGTNAEVDRVHTDLAGRFTLRAKSSGKYKVCWRPYGFVPGCTDTFGLGEQPKFLSTVFVAMQPGGKTATVIGKVAMADNSPVRTFQPLANINARAVVELFAASKRKLYATWVNDFGDYILPQVPLKDAIIFARLEEAEAIQAIVPEANLGAGGVYTYDLHFHNTPPQLEPLSATDTAGNPMQVAAPGQVLVLTANAKDRDGDPISYHWWLAGGAGTLSDKTGQTVKWTLPKAPGLYEVSLIAWDRHGGYSQMQLPMATGDGRVQFSGTVVNNSQQRIGKAEVDVNGDRVATNGNGIFTMRVKAATRYVFNIRAEGYSFYSKIYQRAITGATWRLTGATVQTVDPTKPIEVIDKRSERDCPGPQYLSADWKTYQRVARPQFQDGKGNVIFPDPPKNRDVRTNGYRSEFSRGRMPPMPWEIGRHTCGAGLDVKIPANALVDERGHAPSGKVEIKVGTVDLASPDQMPGDYTVDMSPGASKVMQSFGAGTVEITGGGHRYNLKAPARATVTIPVDPMQLAAGGTIDATIPILYYDEARGVWTSMATANLKGAGNDRHYEFDAPHFTPVNADTLKTDQACVRVLSPSLPSLYHIDVIIPQLNGNAPKIIPKDIVNSAPSEHVIFNLPLHTNIAVIATQTGGGTPIGIYIVNTGDQQNPTTPNQPAGPVYTACSTLLTLTQQIPQTLPTSGEFLQGLDLVDSHLYAGDFDELTASGPDGVALKNALDAQTGIYYTQIDKRSRRTTLLDFRKQNGFADPVTGDPILAGVTNTKYANSGDLGFGRDMYCKKQPGTDAQTDYACYVTNYGLIDGSDQADADKVVAGNPADVFATVAMEYSRIENDPGAAQEFDPGPRTVKFYVYNAAGNLQREAKLDDRGARSVPQLCMVCHGGVVPATTTDPATGHPIPDFSTANDIRLNSKFIAFDLRYLTFPSDAAHLKTNVQVQTDFKTLNVDIVKALEHDIDPTLHVIGDIVDGMYSGGVTTQHEDFSVPGWVVPAQTAKEAFYKSTVANACRTCHSSQFTADLRFDTANGFIAKLGSIGSRVCTQHVMPHAQRTHEIFWGIANPDFPHPVTTNMGGLLEVFGQQFGSAADWGGNSPNYHCGGSFQAGGSTPVSFYQQNIQPIFAANNCTNGGCHGGGSSSAGLALDANSYVHLVGVNSTQLSSMKRVKANEHANSYLFHKLDGSQVAAGGSGQRMPYACSGATCLSAADMSTIQNWIDTRGADGP